MNEAKVKVSSESPPKVSRVISKETGEDAKERMERNKALAKELNAIFVAGHAYWGDPRSYGQESALEGAHHGAFGAGNPDVGYMPELSEIVKKKKPYGAPTSVMDAMEFGVQQAIKQKVPAVVGAYCDQWGCHKAEPQSKDWKMNLSRKGKAQNYQAIVDTSKVPDDFVMVTPMYRNEGLSKENPMGKMIGAVGYRKNKPPIVIDTKNKEQDYKSLAQEIINRAKNKAGQ